MTPHLTGQSADANEAGDKPLFDEDRVSSQREVRQITRGCLPKGRYAISLVYPTGQAWTTPNEIGGCAPSEGPVVLGDGAVSSCASKPRPVLLSQGPRAVVEIVAPTGEGEQTCEDHPVPEPCLHL